MDELVVESPTRSAVTCFTVDVSVASPARSASVLWPARSAETSFSLDETIRRPRFLLPPSPVPLSLSPFPPLPVLSESSSSSSNKPNKKSAVVLVFSVFWVTHGSCRSLLPSLVAPPRRSWVFVPLVVCSVGSLLLNKAGQCAVATCSRSIALANALGYSLIVLHRFRRFEICCIENERLDGGTYGVGQFGGSPMDRLLGTGSAKRRICFMGKLKRRRQIIECANQICDKMQLYRTRTEPALLRLKKCGLAGSV
jgi:hypothetical protein